MADVLSTCNRAVSVAEVDTTRRGVNRDRTHDSAPAGDGTTDAAVVCRFW